MYRCVVLAVGVVAVLVRAGPGTMPACGRLMHGGLQCCKKDILPPKDDKSPGPPDDVKECLKLAKKVPSCDVDKCIAFKRGMASEDGTIDKKKMAEDIEKKFANSPELVDMLKNNCVNGDLSKYGPPDACDLLKQRVCFDVQIIKSCDEWKDDGDCSGMKGLADECLKDFA